MLGIFSKKKDIIVYKFEGGLFIDGICSKSDLANK